MHERKDKSTTKDAPQFRACPIIRYFAKMDAYFPI